VHRDLKPGNIFFALTRSGEMVPKILDFGIAKDLAGAPFEYVQTSSASVLGSPAYMSPEQASGDGDVDGRSDIWSIGIIMYEALTGQLPFAANNYNALMLAIINTPHPPVLLHAPETPGPLAEIVESCLAKERGKRVRSAAQLAEQLERAYCSLTGTPLEHPERSMTITRSLQQASATQSTWSRMRDVVADPRRSRGLVLGAVALVGLVIGLGVWAAQASPAAATRATRFGPLVSAMGARVQAEFDLALARIHAEHAANPSMVIDLDPADPSGSPDRGRGGAKSKGAATASPKTDAPHGGVDSAGF
jgi:serine/threonine-protein kinase